MWTQALLDPLRGKTPLWKVVWIYGFGVSVAYTVLGWVLAPESAAAIAVYVVFGLLLGLVQSLMMWQCAFNSKFRAAGALARVAVIVGLLMIPLMLYVLFRHPEALMPPG